MSEPTCPGKRVPHETHYGPRFRIEHCEGCGRVALTEEERDFIDEHRGRLGLFEEEHALLAIIDRLTKGEPRG